MELIFQITITITVAVVLTVGIAIGLVATLTHINISMGLYKCIDIDGNEIICEQTWRSYGVLYGITKEGKTIDLKSYEECK